MNNIEQIIVRLKTRVALAELIGPDEMIVSASDLSALIAQLEAAHGSIKELESKVNHYVAAEYAHKHFDQTAEIIKRADSAELELVKVKAELSVVNEKLLVPVVLPDDGLEDCINMWPDSWRNDFDTGYNFGIWRCEQNIKAAGFTVEGG